ncbi:hypothetical protein [Chamaesiphon sp. OTE_8_metabat_110]|nr:hypothetical protein [Chamaesiphon sp. OTE_8_metabat_110]
MKYEQLISIRWRLPTCESIVAIAAVHPVCRESIAFPVRASQN